MGRSASSSRWRAARLLEFAARPRHLLRPEEDLRLHQIGRLWKSLNCEIHPPSSTRPSRPSPSRPADPIPALDRVDPNSCVELSVRSRSFDRPGDASWRRSVQILDARRDRRRSASPISSHPQLIPQVDRVQERQRGPRPQGVVTRPSGLGGEALERPPEPVPDRERPGGRASAAPGTMTAMSATTGPRHQPGRSRLAGARVRRVTQAGGVKASSMTWWGRPVCGPVKPLPSIVTKPNRR